MKSYRNIFFSLFALALLASCGAEDAVNEVSNELQVRGHWVMSESDNAGVIEKGIDPKNSLVITFADGSATFEPANTLKGKAVYSALSACVKGPRPYKTENNDLVFPAVTNCPELRVTVIKLDGDVLKFPDPENKSITRTFAKIDDVRYQQLVHQ